MVSADDADRFAGCLDSESRIECREISRFDFGRISRSPSSQALKYVVLTWPRDEASMGLRSVSRRNSADRDRRDRRSGAGTGPYSSTLNMDGKNFDLKNNNSNVLNLCFTSYLLIKVPLMDFSKTFISQMIFLQKKTKFLIHDIRYQILLSHV